MRSLIYRSKKLGLGEIVDEVESAWLQTAALMNMKEDYEGTWSEELFAPLRRTLDDMLVETSPREFLDPEAQVDSELNNSITPVALLNRAWSKFKTVPEQYAVFEQSLIAKYRRGADWSQ